MRKQQALKTATEQHLLKDTIIEAILDKKGDQTVSLDLRSLHDSVADYFVICHAQSTTQVKAIAEHVVDKVQQTTGERPWHKEGFENLEWVLLDYVDVVVHVFLPARRTFYHLEELWNDAPAEHYG